MKRVSVLIITLVMIVSCFCACSGKRVEDEIVAKAVTELVKTANDGLPKQFTANADYKMTSVEDLFSLATEHKYISVDTGLTYNSFREYYDSFWKAAKEKYPDIVFCLVEYSDAETAMSIGGTYIYTNRTPQFKCEVMPAGVVSINHPKEADFFQEYELLKKE